MDRGNSYTVYGDSMAELARAADMVDSYMQRETGRNEIRYKLTNGDLQAGYDTGFITDGALDELRRDFVIVQDAGAPISRTQVKGGSLCKMRLSYKCVSCHFCEMPF